MERLAWIELLDREGAVSQRFPVFHWPVTVGRAYSCDIIVDDPFVAPRHLQLSGNQDDSFAVEDLESLNGMYLNGRRVKQKTAAFTTDDVVRFGHSQLRVRHASHPVADEAPIVPHTWDRQPRTLLLTSMLLLLLTGAAGFLSYNSEDSMAEVLTMVMGVLSVTGIWVSGWTLVGRIFSGQTNFVAHAIIASLGMSVFWMSDALLNLSEFSFNTTALSDHSSLIDFATLSAMLYFHLRLVSRLRKPQLGMIAASASLLLWGLATLTSLVESDQNLTMRDYSTSIAPSFLLFDKGQSVDQFVAGADDLKQQVEE